MADKKRRKESSLEEIIHIVGIAGAFLCSLIFFSANITGSTILNSSVKSSNLIGALLFVVGIVACAFHTRKKY